MFRLRSVLLNVAPSSCKRKSCGNDVGRVCQAMGYIYDKELVHLLFENAPERYGEREGGYCRVLRTMPRQGDNAKMAIIELL